MGVDSHRKKTETYIVHVHAFTQRERDRFTQDGERKIHKRERETNTY